MEHSALKAFADKLLANIEKVIVGKDEIIRQLLISLICGGHVLLEDVPGTGKTLLAKTLSQSLDLQFNRVQFTPDLLPTDITGIHYYNQKQGEFVFRKGPIFTNILLADEINRAPAKVQSALLEAMQEHQVTLGDETHALPEPFLVMATQNPLEQEGTYPLPEAQVDRFMLKVIVNYPDRTEERAILEAMSTSHPDLSVSPVVSADEIMNSRRIVDAVHVDDRIKDYIVDLVWATRAPAQYGLGLDGHVRYGASPRATIALTHAAKAWAFLHGRGYVTPQDVKHLAPDVLRHRIAVSYEAEAENITPEDIVRKVLETLPVP